LTKAMLFLSKGIQLDCEVLLATKYFDLEGDRQRQPRRLSRRDFSLLKKGTDHEPTYIKYSTQAIDKSTAT